MFNKANLSVSQIAMKNNSWRGQTTGVCFTPKYTAATDGQALMLVTTPRNAPVEEYPQILGESVIEDFEPFMISREDAEKIIKTIPKQHGMPILENAAILKTDNGDAVFVTTDLSSVNKTTVKKMDGKFPRITAVSPKGKPTIKLGMTVELLHNLLGAMKKAGAVGITLEIWDDKSAMRVKGNVGDNQKAWALIMPRAM